MEITEHKNEIYSTRVGGFGGSDARMFYKIANKGLSSLSNTDKKRIRVAKGIDEYNPIPTTVAMQLGHDFEDWFDEKISIFGYKREVKFYTKLARNFDTFFHADFSDINQIIELKCTKSPDTAIDDYKAQLHWQHLISGLGVILVTFDANLGYFCNDGIRSQVVSIEDDIVESIKKGIELLDANWDTLDLSIGDEWSDSDLLIWDKNEVEALAGYLRHIKEMEDLAEMHRKRVFEFMQSNNIKCLKSEHYVISFQKESVSMTFDKKKLLVDHPEINEIDYNKETKRNAFIKIQIK